MSGLRRLWATFRAALADAGANRAALGGQMAVMAINDVVWVAFWVLFFRGVGSVRGWDEDRIMLLLAVLTTSGASASGCSPTPAEWARPSSKRGWTPSSRSPSHRWRTCSCVGSRP